MTPWSDIDRLLCALIASALVLILPACSAYGVPIEPTHVADRVAITWVRLPTLEDVDATCREVYRREGRPVPERRLCGCAETRTITGADGATVAFATVYTTLPRAVDDAGYRGWAHESLHGALGAWHGGEPVVC